MKRQELRAVVFHCLTKLADRPINWETRLGSIVRDSVEAVELDIMLSEYTGREEVLEITRLATLTVEEFADLYAIAVEKGYGRDL